MNALNEETAATLAFAAPSGVASRMPAAPGFTIHPPRKAQRTSRSADLCKRFDKWGCLMAAAQVGESRAFEELLRELDVWLRGYYARRLPRAAAEDARQEVLLTIHARRHAYAPSRPFGPWIKAIAFHKWIDSIRDSSRFSALSLHDEIAIKDHEEAALSAVVVDELLGRLKPAQARVIRLVKLQGISIEGASSATGQSAALVKVNIHRGLKKLAALAAGDAIAPETAAASSKRRKIPSSPKRPKGPVRRASAVEIAAKAVG